MIIVSKDRSSFVNMENASGMYIAITDATIKANVVNGNVNVLKMGSYQTMAEAEKAFHMLLKDMETKDICYLPTDEAVKAAMANESHGKTVQHTETGKKLRRHGGS